MDDNTNSTSSAEDNLLHLSNKNSINEYEAKGIVAAELFILQLDIETKISAELLLEIHKIAFAELYDWAGKWRTTNVLVGRIEPPQPYRIPMLMYQFIDNLNFKISIAKDRYDHIECLVYAHYNFIFIHPFLNGNGRTGRLLMNLVALQFGYQPLQLYQRQGESRNIYITALQAADTGNFELLSRLIKEELVAF